MPYLLVYLVTFVLYTTSSRPLIVLHDFEYENVHSHETTLVSLLPFKIKKHEMVKTCHVDIGKI